MNIIVAGGLGFIGSHLVDLLISEGHNVIIVDNLTTNVIDYKKGCYTIFKSVNEAIRSFPSYVSVVFHLASIVGPVGVLGHAGSIGLLTVNDVAMLRDFCIDYNSLFVYVSTSEIYGHTQILHEDAKKVCSKYEVRTEYGVSKLLSEIMIVNKSKIEDRLKYHIIRPFNIAGPRQQPDGGFVLPRFVIAALTGQSLTVFGDGTQRRSFTDVRDVCEAIVEIAFSDFKNEIWNIGNENNETSINLLAQYVIEEVKKRYPNKDFGVINVDPKKIHGSLFSEVGDKLPYVWKTKRFLGWKAKISLKQTISDVVDFYDEKIKNGYSFDIGIKDAKKIEKS